MKNLILFESLFKEILEDLNELNEYRNLGDKKTIEKLLNILYEILDIEEINKNEKFLEILRRFNND